MSAARHPMELAVRAMNGTVAQAAARTSFAGGAADSRAVQAEQLFFALPGERVDGFDFVAQAVASAPPAWSWRAAAACRPGARAPR